MIYSFENHQRTPEVLPQNLLKRLEDALHRWRMIASGVERNLTAVGLRYITDLHRSTHYLQYALEPWAENDKRVKLLKTRLKNLNLAFRGFLGTSAQQSYDRAFKKSNYAQENREWRIPKRILSFPSIISALLGAATVASPALADGGGSSDSHHQIVVNSGTEGAGVASLEMLTGFVEELEQGLDELMSFLDESAATVGRVDTAPSNSGKRGNLDLGSDFPTTPEQQGERVPASAQVYFMSTEFRNWLTEALQIDPRGSNFSVVVNLNQITDENLLLLLPKEAGFSEDIVILQEFIDANREYILSQRNSGEDVVLSMIITTDMQSPNNTEMTLSLLTENARENNKLRVALTSGRYGELVIRPGEQEYIVRVEGALRQTLEQQGLHFEQGEYLVATVALDNNGNLVLTQILLENNNGDIVAYYLVFPDQEDFFKADLMPESQAQTIATPAALYVGSEQVEVSDDAVYIPATVSRENQNNIVQVQFFTATTNARIRESASTNSDILDTLAQGERLLVSGSIVADGYIWYEVIIGDEQDPNALSGWIREDVGTVSAKDMNMPSTELVRNPDLDAALGNGKTVITEASPLINQSLESMLRSSPILVSIGNKEIAVDRSRIALTLDGNRYKYELVSVDDQIIGQWSGENWILYENVQPVEVSSPFFDSAFGLSTEEFSQKIEAVNELIIQSIGNGDKLNEVIDQADGFDPIMMAYYRFGTDPEGNDLLEYWRPFNANDQLTDFETGWVSPQMTVSNPETGHTLIIEMNEKAMANRASYSFSAVVPAADAQQRFIAWDTQFGTELPPGATIFVQILPDDTGVARNPDVAVQVGGAKIGISKVGEDLYLARAFFVPSLEFDYGLSEEFDYAFSSTLGIILHLIVSDQYNSPNIERVVLNGGTWTSEVIENARPLLFPDGERVPFFTLVE